MRRPRSRRATRCPPRWGGTQRVSGRAGPEGRELRRTRNDDVAHRGPTRHLSRRAREPRRPRLARVSDVASGCLGPRAPAARTRLTPLCGLFVAARSSDWEPRWPTTSGVAPGLVRGSSANRHPCDDPPAHQGYLNGCLKPSARRTCVVRRALELPGLLRSLSGPWSRRHWVATVILAMPTSRPGLTASVLNVSLSSGAATSEICTWVPSRTAFEPSVFSGLSVLPLSLKR